MAGACLLITYLRKLASVFRGRGLRGEGRAPGIALPWEVHRGDPSDRFSPSRQMNRKLSARNQPSRSSKDRAPAAKAPENKRQPSLASLRNEIDRLDLNLVSLLNRRAEIVSQIGQIKHDQGLEVWSAAREDEVIAHVLAASNGPLPQDTLRIIFRELMSGSRALQRTIRVAYLGPKYSYSHLASVAKFGEGVEHVPVGSIAVGFRGGQPPPRRVRPGASGKLDRRARRRHARHVHQAAQPQDPGGSAAAHSSLPAGAMRVEPDSPGLFQVAGAFAVPQLAGQEPAPGDQGRGRLDGRRRRTRPARRVCRRRRQPGRRQRLPP